MEADTVKQLMTELRAAGPEFLGMASKAIYIESIMLLSLGIIFVAIGAVSGAVAAEREDGGDALLFSLIPFIGGLILVLFSLSGVLAPESVFLREVFSNGQQ